MAGGSYSRMPMPEEPSRAAIPARATRQLQAVQGGDENATSLLPELHKETRYLSEVYPGSGIAVYEFKEHPLARHRSWLNVLILCMVIVVVGTFVLISAGLFQRTGDSQLVTFSGGQSFPIQVGGSIDNINTWENSNGPLAPKKPLHVGPYSVLSKPTITVDFINQVLASYHSPAAGKGQAMYDLGLKYGVDPVYALAFFLHESTMGTAGEARTTLSLGNLRCIPARPCIDQNRGGYAQMYSWEDGFEQWYKLIRNLYVAQWGRVTVDQIIPKYAPSSDGNDEQGYIAALKHYIDTWHAGILRP